MCEGLLQTETRQTFADVGGYAALEAILCRRNLSLEQQRVCFKAFLSWLTPASGGGGAMAPPTGQRDKQDRRHVVVLLLRVLEVCDAQVRLEAVRAIKTLVYTCKEVSGAVIAVTGWTDLLLKLVHGIGGEPPSCAAQDIPGAPVLMPASFSTPEDGCNWIYDEVIQVVTHVVNHRLLHGRKGYLTLLDAMAALSRFRLPGAGDAAGVEGGWGGMGAGIEAIERRLSSSARLLLVSYMETLGKLVGSMMMWEAEASFRSQAVPGRNADTTLKEAVHVRDEVAGLLVVVHIFLLSGFSEEQRSMLSGDRLSGDRVPAAAGTSSGHPSGALLLVRGLRMSSGPTERGSGEGGSEGLNFGQGSWLDRAIVSEAILLLHTLNSLPNSPHTLCVKDLCFQEGELQRADYELSSQSWPVATFFLTLCLLYDLIGRAPADKVRLEPTETQAGVQPMQDTRLEVVMCCETLKRRCCWTSECGPGGPGYWDEHYPWSSFAFRLLREYAVEYQGTALQLPLTTTAIELAQYSRQEDIYYLSQEAKGGVPQARNRNPANAQLTTVDSICEHHCLRSSCVHCKSTAHVETAAQTTHRLLHVPLDKSVATFSDFYEHNSQEEEEKEARYLQLLKGESTLNMLQHDRQLEPLEQESVANVDNATEPYPSGTDKDSHVQQVHAAESGQHVHTAASGQTSLLETLDWCAPALTGHLSFATSQMCVYERKLLSKWCDVIDQGERLLERSACEREHTALVLLQQCEDIQKESDGIENKRLGLDRNP